MRILILDNEDSFTYNLHHYIADSCDVDVYRENEIYVEDVAKYDGIILSPGPGLPSARPLMTEIIKRHHKSIPTLGVCLGMQAIAEYFGGSLYNLDTIIHGKASSCKIQDADPLFNDVPESFEVGRYHSWAVNLNSVPDFIPLASTGDGVLMAMKHRNHPLYAVQFHPESVLTPHGKTMMLNWLATINSK